MKLRCKQEAIDDDGKKVMEFTKGSIYEAHEYDEGYFVIYDDYGNRETFFYPNIMFEPI